MTLYTAEHSRAYGLIGRKGADVTFTRTASGYNASAGTVTVVDTTVVGKAVRTKGDPVMYQTLGLVETEAPTLLFSGTTYGGSPEPGDKVTWASKVYTVRHVEPVAPDGTAILCRVVVSR